MKPEEPLIADPAPYLATKRKTIERPRRFYKIADIAPHGEGFAVTLDGRTPKTPAKLPLVLPNQTAALLVAAEWAGQDTHILPEDMPVTRLVNIAIDRASATRSEMIAEVVKYAGTDLVCYRAPNPESLVTAQSAAWDGVLDYVASRYGVALVTTTSALAVAQPAAALEAVGRFGEGLNDFALTALTFATGISGSAVLAIALVDGWMDGETAFKAIRVEEDWQGERWGVDPDEAFVAQGRRRDLIAVRALMAAFAELT